MIGPMMKFAARCLPPSCTFSAVLESEAPTGIPPKSAEAALPAPCPTKSRFMLEYVPPGFGTALLMPAPWISPTIATESAGTTKVRSPLSCGITNVGSAEGISAVSPTSTTPIPASFTTRVETTSAIGKANVESRVRPTPRMIATVRRATNIVARSRANGWRAASTNRIDLFANSLL